jgi:hypothetical protein
MSLCNTTPKPSKKETCNHLRNNSTMAEWAQRENATPKLTSLVLQISTYVVQD